MMGGRELDQHVLAVGHVDARVQRAAAVHVADRIAAEHPHPLDDVMPRLAGRLIGRNPDARQRLVELLEALGLVRGVTELEQLQNREVDLEAELIIATAENTRLQGGES